MNFVPEWRSPLRAEVDHQAQERLSAKEGQDPELVVAEIQSRLKEVTDALIRASEDALRRELTVERAVLLRMRQMIEGDDGVRELPKTVSDAPDMVMVGDEDVVSSYRADSTMVDFDKETKNTFVFDNVPPHSSGLSETVPDISVKKEAA